MENDSCTEIDVLIAVGVVSWEFIAEYPNCKINRYLFILIVTHTNKIHQKIHLLNITKSIKSNVDVDAW